MESVIEEADDEVVERRTRRLHLVESVEATVSAWHGGRKVAELGCRNSVAAAVERAAEAAREFGVGPSSSMRIRVAEKAVRSWKALKGVDHRGDPVYEDGTARFRLVSRHRHAWDDAQGLIEPRWEPWEFEVEEWIGHPGDAPPRAVVAALYAAVSVEGCRDDDLLALYGTGLPTVRSVVGEAAEPPGRLAGIGGRRGMRGYVRVRVRGSVHVTAPPGATMPETAGFLGRLWAEVQRDRRSWDGLDLASPGCMVWSDPDRRGAASWRPGDGTPLLA